MKNNRLIALLLTAAFVFCLFGCEKRPEGTDAAPEPTEAATEAPAEAPTDAPTEAPTEEPEPLPQRMKNGGKLSFLPEEPIDVPKLSEMEYERPDTETLIAGYEALTEKTVKCDDAEALLQDYYALAEQRHNYGSMAALAYFRFCTDTGDEYYSAEYDFCDEQGTYVEEKENALLAAFAASPCRGELEKEYFGEGFFLDYDQFNEADETYYELKQRENDLLFEYYELIADADLYSDAGLSENHEELGKLFIELVRTRGQIAKAKGYENYMDMSYACDFKRDYTTAEARGFMGLVKEKLAPMMEYTKITGIYSYYSSWNESKWEEMLSTAAEKMGGPIWESCRFLLEHELYDFSYSSKKLNIGYTDYIDNYEAPVIFVDPSGRDLVYTLFHEFGHFTDFYRNYGFSESYEIAETYSQAMQYLAFAYSEPFSDRDRNTNLRATLSDLLVYAVLREAAFADFELQVYSLPADELTQEKLDEVYAQCIKDYGLEDEGSIWTNEKFWIASSHFFSYPGYVISYSVSAVAALQICRMEAEEPGAGVDAYLRLLDRTRGKKFAAVIEEAELDSPFEAETIEKTAEFLSGAFELN